MAALTKQKAQKPKTLVVGASGRMVAEMLARLGFECSVADLYGDRDTHLICEGRVTRLTRLADIASHEGLVREHDFVIFSGGLEGNGNLAGELAKWTKAAFSPNKSICDLENYEVLNQAMAEVSLDRFPFSIELKVADLNETVCKNLRHSGSARLASEEDTRNVLSNGMVFQRVIDGTSVSLIFLANDGFVKQLGGSTQSVEVRNRFAWVGSVSGLRLNEEHRDAATRFAAAVARLVGLQGVFGIDFIFNDEGIWPVDVNPRIPASAEIVGDHVIQQHLVAFGIECPTVAKPADETVRIKRVIFNRTGRQIQFDRRCIDNVPFHFADVNARDSIADVPHHGESIEPDHPILTVFASGANRNEALQNVSRRKSRIIDDFRAGFE